MNIIENRLRKIISRYNTAVIAFSGGVDSSFLARFANDVLNGKIVLVTVSFSAVTEEELQDSIRIASELNLKHKIIKINELEIPHFSENPHDRCYHCKKHLFSKIKEYAESINYDIVLDGSNADDIEDYRPGRVALKELKIVSPLLEAGMTKDKIRNFSKMYNLSTSSKPSYACLASRIPYGEIINAEKLQKISTAEAGIRSLGFSQFRVRNHENLARLEFIPDEMDKAYKLKESLSDICIRAGYTYVAIDCSGYRMGNLNSDLSENVIKKYK
jgi:pyridinium-3,5-biscarboxylic acid mononucleotide sulfurtransferase